MIYSILVCLSLAPNLRCVGFSLGQFKALIIPSVIEVLISLFFISLYSGPARWAQVLLTVDSILYFALALLDMLSHTVTAVYISLPAFRALDFLVGAASFTPILFYSIYLYRLSLHDFIPTLPRKLQPYLQTLLPALLVVAIVMNEVSSFVGTNFETVPNRPLVVVQFPHDNQSSWFSLSQSALTIYTIIQFLFFLLAFSRLSKAFFNQRRLELAHSNERHHLNGMAWVTVGILIGVIEVIAGFARVSFGVALARRILRLIARATLMFGVFKGLDTVEGLESLTGELHGASRISEHISHIFGINRKLRMFRRISQPCSEQLRTDQCSPAEKLSRPQRVTVHYQTGQAPSLQIRLSTFDFSTQSILPDVAQQRRRSLSGLIPGHAGTSTQQYVSDEMTTPRNPLLETRRAKSALVATSCNQHVVPDWVRPPQKIHTRQGSGETISDSLSIVRDLERKFPSLPPRVTGKYRGSILGQNYEEDLFPVVGVSRQSSLRQDGGTNNPSEEGGASTALSSSGSIKRKPAPPLLENIAYISDRRGRRVSTWGGLTENTANHPVESPVRSSSLKAVTAYGQDTAADREHTSLKSRGTTTRDVLRRASRALSDASIRSAEWLASASSPRAARTPLTVADIEMYRRGTLGPRSALKSDKNDTSSIENLLPSGCRRSTDDARAHPEPSQGRTNAGI